MVQIVDIGWFAQRRNALQGVVSRPYVTGLFLLCLTLKLTLYTSFWKMSKSSIIGGAYPYGIFQISVIA